MLKLVYTNPNAIPANQFSIFSTVNTKEKIAASQLTSVTNFLPHFTAKLSRMDHYSYGMAVCDPSHYLSCNLVLEVRENGDESAFGDVICDFPAIQVDYLEAFVWEDDTLMALILTQFYIKILEQLLVFCANHNALKLFIHTHPSEVGPLEAYEDFIVHSDQVLTHQGRRVAHAIPTDKASYDKLVDYMEEIGTDFHEILCQEQHANPIIRQYLKLNKFS